MAVAVSTRGLGGRPSIGRATVARRAQAMLDALGKGRGELSVLLCDDVTIRELNRSYRDKDRATDVLSFPMPPAPGQHGGPQILGDIVISLPTAARQSGSARGGLRAEVTRLLAHGLLHLLGWTHQSEGSLLRMEAEMDRLVSVASARQRSEG